MPDRHSELPDNHRPSHCDLTHAPLNHSASGRTRRSFIALPPTCARSAPAFRGLSVRVGEAFAKCAEKSGLRGFGCVQMGGTAVLDAGWGLPGHEDSQRKGSA